MAAFQFRQHRGKRNRRPYITTTAAPTETHLEDDHTKHESTKLMDDNDDADANEQRPASPSATLAPERPHEDPIINRIASSLSVSARHHIASDIRRMPDPIIIEKSTRPDHIPDITSLFSNAPTQVQKDSAFDGLETHEVRSISRSSPILSAEHREESADYENAETELPNNALEAAHTIGPYDSMKDYQSDQGDLVTPVKEQEEDSSTILPEAEPAYRYNIKVRSNGKVLDPPSK